MILPHPPTDALCRFHYRIEDFNLFIIDDHSRDNSISIIEKYSDSRIKVIKLKRNKGSIWTNIQNT